MTANTDPARMARLRREAMRCTTHHEACACRELAHAEAEAEVERLRGLVQREHDARLELAREAETLLRERDAAETTDAALRAFVGDVAGTHQHMWEYVYPPGTWGCAECGERAHLYAADLQEAARALLAATPSEGSVEP